jgi:hypothetical protein
MKDDGTLLTLGVTAALGAAALVARRGSLSRDGGKEDRPKPIRKDIGKVRANGETLVIRHTEYRPGRNAIIFYSEDPDEGTMGRLSSDLKDVPLAPDEFVVAGEELHPTAIRIFYRTQLFEDTGRVEKVGDRGGPVWRIKAWS